MWIFRSTRSLYHFAELKLRSLQLRIFFLEFCKLACLVSIRTDVAGLIRSGLGDLQLLWVAVTAAGASRRAWLGCCRTCVWKESSSSSWIFFYFSLAGSRIEPHGPYQPAGLCISYGVHAWLSSSDDRPVIQSVLVAKLAISQICSTPVLLSWRK